MDYLGLLIRAALLLRRYENSIIREDIDPLFSELHRQLTAAARPSLLNADRARIAKVLADVFLKIERRAGRDIALVAHAHAERVEAAIEQRAKKTRGEAGPMKHLNAKPAAPNVQTGLPAVGNNRAQEILDGDAFDGATFKRWQEIHRDKAIRDTQIHTALSRNAKETPAQLRQRLLERVTRPAQQRARALVRTFTLNVSQALAWEAAEANPDTVGYRLLVVLDGRTSPICIAHSAEHKVYQFVPGSPRPPLHYSCRTTIYPLIKGRVNERPPDAEKWMQGKSAAEQDEILGESRGKMYRAGEITLAGLINSENRVLDLAELRGVSSGSGIR